MKTLDLFFVKFFTFICYCPLFNSNDLLVLLFIINEDYNNGATFRRLEDLSGLSKTPFVRSLKILQLSRLVKQDEETKKYFFNRDRTEYRIPASTVAIINAQEALLGLPESSIANVLKDSEDAWNFLQRNIQGYAQVKEDTFVKAYQKKEKVAQEYIQTLLSRNKRANASFSQSTPSRLRL